MVGQVGFEPTANALKGHCSTTELLTQREYWREYRDKGRAFCLFRFATNRWH